MVQLKERCTTVEGVCTGSASEYKDQKCHINNVDSPVDAVTCRPE